MFKINQEKLRNDLKLIEFDSQELVVISAYCQFGFFGVSGNLTQGKKTIVLKTEVDEDFPQSESSIYRVMSESAGKIGLELKDILEKEYGFSTKFKFA